MTEVTATAGGAAAARSNERLQGILFLCAGAMIFTIQDVIIKWISDEYAVTQILATRSLVAFAPLFILLHLDGGLRGVNGRRLGRLLVRAGLLFASYTTYYLAIAAIPLAEAVSLFYTAPLFIVALSGPMLQRAGRPDALARRGRRLHRRSRHVPAGRRRRRPGGAAVAVLRRALCPGAGDGARSRHDLSRLRHGAGPELGQSLPPPWRLGSSPATAPMPAPPIPAWPSCCARGRYRRRSTCC